jgi:hypothetical protein
MIDQTELMSERHVAENGYAIKERGYPNGYAIKESGFPVCG